MPTIVDALGQSLRFPHRPTRIVSLVPSETHAVFALGAGDRLVGRTRYCVEPALPEVPIVGGTKDIDVDAVVALEPDLVLANREESAKRPVEALIARGLTVHISFPQRVIEAVDYLYVLAQILRVEPSHAETLEARRATLAGDERRPVRVFAPVWNDPWMTFDGRTFASDVLELAGAENVFADRPRRYPLAADLGRAAPLPASRVGERDTRYPRVTLEEVSARAPELVLLTDEPHDFGPDDARALVELGIPEDRVVFLSGKDLFWYGAWTESALARLSALIDGYRSA